MKFEHLKRTVTVARIDVIKIHRWFCLFLKNEWSKSSISHWDTGNGKRITGVVSFVRRDTSSRHYNTDVQAVLNDETPWKL